jgi:hypothetical protein
MNATLIAKYQKFVSRMKGPGEPISEKFCADMKTAFPRIAFTVPNLRKKFKELLEEVQPVRSLADHSIAIGDYTDVDGHDLWGEVRTALAKESISPMDLLDKSETWFKKHVLPAQENQVS